MISKCTFAELLVLKSYKHKEMYYFQFLDHKVSIMITELFNFDFGGELGKYLGLSHCTDEDTEAPGE